MAEDAALSLVHLEPGPVAPVRLDARVQEEDGLAEGEKSRSGEVSVLDGVVAVERPVIGKQVGGEGVDTADAVPGLLSGGGAEW